MGIILPRRSKFAAADTPGGSGLLTAGKLLGHVEQELLVLLANAPQKPLDLLEEAQLFFLRRVEGQLFRRSTAAEIRQRRWFVPFVEELVQGKFQRPGKPLEGFEGRNRVSVLNSRDVTAQQASPLFYVALGKVSFRSQFLETFSDDHVSIFPESDEIVNLKLRL